jgi:nucleotidyltransferase/DNA polymerase involved in DNA repair
MDYLLMQIFWFLLIAFILGLLAGWLIGRGRVETVVQEDPAAARRIAELEAELAALRNTDPGTPVEEIEGIGKGFGKRLRADGIASVEKLLEVCTAGDGVSRVSRTAEVDEHTVSTWAIMADLMRVRGLGGQWSELLWRCGVTSVQDLAKREVAPLMARMAEVNTDEHRVAELPGEHRVAQFIEEAGRLAPKLTNA